QAEPPPEPPGFPLLCRSLCPSAPLLPAEPFAPAFTPAAPFTPGVPVPAFAVTYATVSPLQFWHAIAMDEVLLPVAVGASAVIWLARVSARRLEPGAAHPCPASRAPVRRTTWPSLRDQLSAALYPP